MTTTWGFYVDWADDYDYIDAIDNITDYVQEAEWSLGLSEPYQTVAPAAHLSLTVRNTDGRFNPENSSSPLLGYLVPGRRVKITAAWSGGSTEFAFIVESITPQWKPTGTNTGITEARIKCVDLSAWLERDTSPTALFQNKRADEIIKSILLQAPQVPVVPNVWVLGKTGFSELGGVTVEDSGVQTGVASGIGNSGGTHFLAAQSFQCAAGTLTEFSFTLSTNNGTPTGTQNWSIQTNSAGAPSGTSLVSGTVTPIESAKNIVVVESGPTLSAATTYWLVLESSTAQDLGDFWRWQAASVGTYPNGQRAFSSNAGASWTADGRDHTFSITILTTAGATVLAADSDFMTLDEGISTFALYGDTSQTRRTDNAAAAVDERSSKRIIAEIVAAERGRFFFNRAGKGEFWNRHHMPLIISTAGTVSSTGDNKPVKVDYLTDRRYFANNVEIQPHQRATGDEIVLWQLESSFEIQAGGDPFEMDAQYLNAEGNPTGAVNVIRGEFTQTGSITLGFKPMGDRAKLKFKNEGSTTAAVGALTIIGQPVSGKNKLTAYAEDQTSIGLYGKTPPLRLNLPAMDDYEVAVSAAKYEVSRRSDPNALITKVHFTLNPHEKTFTLEWGIGTRITVDLPELGHEKDYIIIGESHSLSDGFRVLKSSFNLEPAETNAFWVLGTSTLGETTRILY